MNLSAHFLLTLSGRVPHDIQMIQVTVMFVVMLVSVHEKSLKGTVLLEETSVIFMESYALIMGGDTEK